MTIHFTEQRWYEPPWEIVSLWIKGKVKVTQSCTTPCSPRGVYGSRNSPGQNTGVGSLSLLQGIFPIQGSSPGISHCRRILHQLSHRGAYEWRRNSNVQPIMLPRFAVIVQWLSRVLLFATPWTAARQVPLSVTKVWIN